MQHFRTLSELHRVNGYPPPENPLLSLLRCTKACPDGDDKYSSDIYEISLKKMKAGTILYGRTKYDHDSGCLFFTKPCQVVQLRNVELEEDGFSILFHEDFLNGHPLHGRIRKYHYFDYDINEALHISPREKEIIWELYKKVETEYYNNQDKYSREIILAQIDSILKYSQRFYDRQFLNRVAMSGPVATKFNNSLAAYFESGRLAEEGLPSVKYMADLLQMSPGYLSDLLKQESGKSAIEHIHFFIISEAKNLLKGGPYNISEIASTLGFENLPYFSRLFKKAVGVTPVQYKKRVLSEN